MEKILDGKIIVVDNSDNKKQIQVGGGFLLYNKADYILHYNNDTQELTVLKERRKVKSNEPQIRE